MGALRQLARRRPLSAGWKLCAVGLIGCALPTQTSEAAPPTPAEILARTAAWQPAGDVAVGSDGVLRGRVLGAGGATAGLAVRFVAGNRTVAATQTDPGGEFAVQNLEGGTYLVMVEGAGPPSWRCVRVWASSRAPPRAAAALEVAWGEPVVRGQRPMPFPLMSLRQAATISAVAAGAIAAPVIYHNALMDNRVPASP